MLNVIAPVLPPHTEHMYGYDQEVVSRELEGEVGGAEVGGPQGNENPECSSQGRICSALHVEAQRYAQEAGGGHEEEKHCIEEERYREKAEHHGAEAWWRDGTEEERHCEEEHFQEEHFQEEHFQEEHDQEEHDQEEEHRRARAEASREAGQTREARRHRSDSAGHGRRSRSGG